MRLRTLAPRYWLGWLLFRLDWFVVAPLLAAFRGPTRPSDDGKSRTVWGYE